MTSNETTAERTALRKRPLFWVLASALFLTASVSLFTFGDQQPPKYVGAWEFLASSSDAKQRQLELAADGTLWLTDEGDRKKEGVWHGSDSELVMVLGVRPQHPSFGQWLEEAARFVQDPRKLNRTLRYAVTVSGDTLTLWPTEEFGRPPQNPPQEIQFKRRPE